jgi:DNA-binding MarR family transcriptional regulator
MTKVTQNTAQQVMEVVPLVMRTMRAKLRERRAADISVPQFRAMAYINRNAGASLSDLSAHIGLTLPSMSKLIDGLVTRNLITRTGHSQDRRRVCLSLTPQGRDELNEAYGHTQKYIAGKMSGLTEEDLKSISRAMQVLRELFRLEREEELNLQGGR